MEQPPQNLSPFIFTQKWRRSQSDVPCVDTEIHQRSPPRTAPQIHHVMYFIYFFCVCHMHAEPTANQGLDAVACQKGSRHHKLPTLFLFPHRVYKCIFLLARCLPNYYSSKHQARTHSLKSMSCCYTIIRVCG